MNKKTVLMSLLVFAVALPMLEQPAFPSPGGQYFIYCTATAESLPIVTKGDTTKRPTGDPMWVKEQYAFKGHTDNEPYAYAAFHGIVQVRASAKLAIIVEAEAVVQNDHADTYLFAEGWGGVLVQWDTDYDLDICWQGGELYYNPWLAVNAHIFRTLEINIGSDHSYYEKGELTQTGPPGGPNPLVIPPCTFHWWIPAGTPVEVILDCWVRVDKGGAYCRSGFPPLVNDP